jgi:hypothetical protein
MSGERKKGDKREMGAHFSHYLLIIFTKSFGESSCGFWGFGAKPLLRIGFGGERFHPS